MGDLRKLFDAKTWVFDLDNTLYPQECDLFSQIEVKMNEYVASFLKLPKDEARIIQKKYYVEYGTTLNGLMKNHDVDPSHYLHHVHDIDYSSITPNPQLRDAIKALEGDKLVFTNGSKGHAQKALDALGFNGLFSDVIDIAETKFEPKPKREAFDILVKKHGLNTKDSVMVEDLSKNLLTAHDMGFMTVLVWSDKVWDNEPDGHAPAGEGDIEKEHIHFATNNLASFIEQVLKEKHS